jgi:hypothetical protein
MKIKMFVYSCLVILLLSGTQVSAQQSSPRDPMNVNTWMINFGIGPGIRYNSGYSTGFGPGFQASFEKGMWQLGPGVLTLGAEVGVSYFSYKYAGGYFYNNRFYNGDTYSYKWLNFIMSPRCAYHYGWKVKGLDTYGGVSTGLRFLVFSRKYYGNYNGLLDNGYNPGSLAFFFGTFVGASYFFNNSLGINGEFGYNINYAQIGLVFKLN